MCYAVALTTLFAFCHLSASAKPVTYVKEYTYQASELDSKLSSRTIALEQVKRLLLEELGTYLISETAIKDFELTKDQISSLTAGIVMTVILDEKWDGKTYFLRAKITAETDDLLKSLNSIRQDRSQVQDWDEMRKKMEAALKEIDELKKEIGKARGEKTEKAAQEKYAKAVDELNALEWFKKGFKLTIVDRNYREAMEAFNKSIEIDPQYAKAYAMKSRVYIESGQYADGLKEADQAVKLDPSLSWGFSARGAAYVALKEYQKGIEDLTKAIELEPTFANPYCHRSWAYFMLKDYPRAVADAGKAITLDPKYSLAYYRRGRALASLDKNEEAIKDFNEAIRLDPKFSWPFVYRGYAFSKLNMPQQSVDDFKIAARLGNSHAQTYLRSKAIEW